MNVFRKENRRRILFTLTLTLLTAALSFGFVSRAVEYLAVRQELERLSDHYRTIGWLTSADGNVAPGAELIKDSSYVETADNRRFLWGTLTDLYNADLQGRFEGYWYDMFGVNNSEVLFWGTLKYVDEEWYERSWTDSSTELDADRLVFTVSERISGYPDYAPEGGDVNFVFTDEMLEESGWELPELTVGERYLVRAYYSGDRNGSWPGYELWVKAEGGHALSAMPVQENRLILTEAEGNEALAALASDQKSQLDELNRHSMMVIATQDMSAMPAAQEVQRRMFLTEGRWLDGIDSDTGAAVCAVHKDFAEARGLHVGDTLELTFRSAQLQVYAYASGEQDISDWQSYESETKQYTIAGIFDYMPLNVVGHNFTEETLELYIPYGSAPEAYIRDGGIVAQNFSFVLKDPQDTDAFLSEVREPLAALGMQIQLIENDWEHFAVSANAMEQTARTGVLVFAGVLCIGFALIAFLYGRQNRKSFGIARALGVPKGKCVRMCLSPILFMSAVGSSTGTLLSWRYALGEAEKMLTGMREHAEMSLSAWWLAGLVVLLTILLSAAAAAGILVTARRPVLELLHNVSGGRKAADPAEAEYTKGKAAETCGAVKAVIPENAGTAAEPNSEDKRQEGGRQAAEDTDGSLAQVFRTGRISLPAEAGKGKGTVFACRFVFRHMGRRPVHTALICAVALAFLAAVTWMQVSIIWDTAEVNRMYETTEVDGELVKRDLAVEVGFGGACFTQDMIDWLMESGYVRDLYAEAADAVRVTRVVRNWYIGETLSSQLIGSQVPMRSTEDIERFCRENHVEIDYADGYGPELFTTEWKYTVPYIGGITLKDDTPVIVPEIWLEQYDLELGQSLEIQASNGACVMPGPVIGGTIRHVEAGDGITRGTWNSILIPASAWELYKEEKDWTYSCVRFTMDPAFNRELDTIKEEITKQLQNPRMALMDADVMLWTGELRQVVEPFEKNLDLMKLLFPVTVAVSVIAGGGLIFLLLLQRTEEAALLRVLGNSRGRTRRMLIAEPVLLSLAGLLAGGCAVYYGFPELSIRQIGMFAGAYLGGCVLGAIFGTVHITRKMPLELLQVKE